MNKLLELAGMKLDRPFEPGAIVVPSRARLDGNRIVWALAGIKYKSPRPSVLDRFRRLHRAPPEKILGFVREFGPAYFCEQHGLPGSHSQVSFGRQFGMEECGPTTWQEDLVFWFGEEVEYYRRYSRAADSIVNAAAMVNLNRVPSDDVFAHFMFSYGPVSETGPVILEHVQGKQIRKKTLLQGARERIREEVNLWIALSQCHPRLDWRSSSKTWRQTIEHSTWGVLGPVALALFTTVPQSNGWLICDICADAYEPTRAPVEGRNHFCPDCRGSAEMWRFLKRQQRSKER